MKTNLNKTIKNNTMKIIDKMGKYLTNKMIASSQNKEIK